MYDTEAAFSRSLSSKLAHAGLYVQRLESHGTGNGIPDMFIMGHGFDCFLELKNSNKKGSGDRICVPWRPGQQAWMHSYYFAHECKKCCVTLMSINSGVVVIPMTKVYENNVVEKAFIVTWDQWSKLQLDQFIRDVSECMVPNEALKKHMCSTPTASIDS